MYIIVGNMTVYIIMLHYSTAKFSETSIGVVYPLILSYIKFHIQTIIPSD